MGSVTIEDKMDKYVDGSLRKATEILKIVMCKKCNVWHSSVSVGHVRQMAD